MTDMTAPGTATVTIEVVVDAKEAFRAFTDDIDAWWQRDPINWNDPERAVGIRFESGVGERWIEVHDGAPARASRWVAHRLGRRIAIGVLLSRCGA